MRLLSGAVTRMTVTRMTLLSGARRGGHTVVAIAEQAADRFCVYDS
ncbi:hypothetical protein [Novipirellula galeiformis]|nr:hypothetical protein [Novipirellula galeiformis]